MAYKRLHWIPSDKLRIEVSRRSAMDKYLYQQGFTPLQCNEKCKSDRRLFVHESELSQANEGSL